MGNIPQGVPVSGVHREAPFLRCAGVRARMTLPARVRQGFEVVA